MDEWKEASPNVWRHSLHSSSQSSLSGPAERGTESGRGATTTKPPCVSTSPSLTPSTVSLTSEPRNPSLPSAVILPPSSLPSFLIPYNHNAPHSRLKDCLALKGHLQSLPPECSPEGSDVSYVLTPHTSLCIQQRSKSYRHGTVSLITYTE